MKYILKLIALALLLASCNPRNSYDVKQGDTIVLESSQPYLSLDYKLNGMDVIYRREYSNIVKVRVKYAGDKGIITHGDYFLTWHEVNSKFLYKTSKK